MMKHIFQIGILCLLLGFGLNSCKKDKFITDSTAKLEFSSKAILFDTVFTTVGSVTKSFRVYNKSSQPIKISSIRLAGSTNSNFRINVDGEKGMSFSDVEIKGKDSLFVFAEVTVDPNKVNSPLIVRDSIVFETNGNVQDVHLEAWGQDAYFYTPKATLHFPNGTTLDYSVVPCINGVATWKNDKPHVVYGYLVVDSACTLNIEAGTKVYMHPKSALWVYKDGTLKVNENGDVSSPVIIQGDRLEPEYAEAAGQWERIWLSAGSKNNIINAAIIKNGLIGVQADTIGNSSNPTLTISNTIIKNMNVAAIFGQGSYIKGWNCVFANCGQYVTALKLGGKYNFYQCTFANYWNATTRQFSTLLINNYYEKDKVIYPYPLDSAYFYNCIVYGDLNTGDEVKLDPYSGSTLNFKFHNCLLKTTAATASVNGYENVITNMDPYFNDVGANDYRIKNPYSLPAVIDKGDPAIGRLFPTDLSGYSRMVNGNPDLGAFEYKP